jgi:2-methylcitrate dehydratase PrpD
VRHVHYGAELARGIRAELEGNTANITRIALSIYPEAITYCGNRAPAVPIQAQFSLSFGVAAMLRFGVLDHSVYRAGRFDDAELRRLEALVEVRVDRVLEEQGRRGATLLVSSGYNDIERDVRAIPGDASRPLSAEEVAAKFMRYAQVSVPNEKAFVFANAVLAAEVDVNMRALWDLLF